MLLVILQLPPPSLSKLSQEEETESLDGGDRTVSDSPDEALWCKVCAAETKDADPVAKVGTSKGRPLLCSWRHSRSPRRPKGRIEATSHNNIH